MKAANSYASLLRGVSQQVPQDRAEGQHTEQVNMLSDPVNGLVRRHGSIWQSELQVPVGLADLPAAQLDTNSWVSYDFDTGGKEYSVLYRTAERPVDSDLPVMYVYNKTDKQWLLRQFIPGDTNFENVELGGISALTSVGKYLFFGGNTLPVSAQITPKYGTTENSTAVVWVRGGAYSRTFKITYRIVGDNTIRVAQYNTPAASYQGTLTTSDILSTDTEYVKKVNDRVNAYNSAVTAYIGTAAAGIAPAAIAAALKSGIQVAVPAVMLVGSCIVMQGVLLESLEVDDGGDGSLMVAVWNEVPSVDKVSPIHVNNKVVKVRAANSNESYYLRAVSKDSAIANNPNNYNVGEVIWVEGTATDQAITGGLCYATIVGPVIYMASSAALLSTILPGDHPTFSPATVGDLDSQPTPSFVGKPIDYLGTFQNRLIIGAGATLSLSKTEDYLNFFRSTVLTIPADDPFELLAQGSEDDTIRHSVLYDRDLVLFGRKRQYVLQGNVAVTPTSANLAVLTNYEGVADTPPLAAGSYIFYAKRGEGSSSVHQVQPGQTDNTPESFPASSQLDNYINDNLIEFASSTGSPSHLFARASGARNSIYVFTYLDKTDGRKLDSWSRWDFADLLGPIIGFSVVQGGLLVYHLRPSTSGLRMYTVADFVPLDTSLSKLPYLDSNRPVLALGSPDHSIDIGDYNQWIIALGAESVKKFNGAPLDKINEFVAQYPSEPNKIVGCLQNAYFSPTNPYMRDTKEKAILSGRLTVTKKVVAFKESSGFRWTISYRNLVVADTEFSGRLLGDPANRIGVEPISTGQFSIPVGRETRQYQLTIFARKWLPLTITGVEWVGQWFNRVQRF